MPDTYIGQEIDGFRILEELGRGGMGVVYKAEDVALARPVALKMIARELSRDESFVRRFRSEARALARINSSYITSIYALRRTDDGIFIVMEFIGGGTLGDKMERGPVRWADIRAPFLEMISALEHAHGVGVIHRDIKPGNILLTEDGHVKVTDFGLAKLHTADQGMTVTQGIAGTLYYMSPEQVKGERNLDGRSDLYALGITIYEALSGRLPFDRGGSEFSTMRKIVEDQYPPLGEFARDLPPGLESAVMKALAKSPDDRYANAAAMREAFEAIPGDAAPARLNTNGPPPRREAETVVAGEAYQSAPPPVVTKQAVPKQRMMIGGGVFAVLALAALAYFFWPSGSTTPLSVSTDPPGAAVYFDGREIGRTPLESVAVRGEGGRLRVERVGYATVDTTLSFTEGEPMNLLLPLVAVASTGDGNVGSARVALLNVASNPSGATVVIDGQRVGETPYTHRDSTGRPLSVRLERRGYQPYSETGVVLNPASPREIRADLERVTTLPSDNAPPGNTASDPPPAQTGTLVLRSNEGGTVTVNGQSRPDSGTFTVPVGTQTVRCTHPDYGNATGPVTIRAGQTTTATCYFQANVNVQATGESTWGSVWVNNRNAGETGVIKLPPGTHTVEVRRSGFRSVEPPQPVTIRAGLVQQTERLVFTLQKEE
ncbi:MAG: PEGA domain-containing protein [Rhodothermales bacterium]